MITKSGGDLFYSKSIAGRIIEIIVGLLITIMASPFLIVYIFSAYFKFYTGKICDILSDLDDNISIKITKMFG